MGTTFTYRPRHFSVTELKNIATKFHTNLNRFIEEAVTEKIQKVTSTGESEVLAGKINQVIVEHFGVRLKRPGPSTHAKILKKARENDRKGTWIKDEDVRPEQYK